MKNKKGFTLVELVIVIVIVGILSVVSVPIYKGYVKRAYAAEGWALLGMIQTAQKVYYSDYGYFGGQEEMEKEINPQSNKYFTSFTVQGGGTQAWTAITNGINEASEISLTMIGSSNSGVRTFGAGAPGSQEAADDNSSNESTDIGDNIEDIITCEYMVRAWNSPYDYMVQVNLPNVDGKEAYFHINGETYSSRLDNNGIATLHSPFPVGEYEGTFVYESYEVPIRFKIVPRLIGD